MLLIDMLRELSTLYTSTALGHTGDGQDGERNGHMEVRAKLGSIQQPDRR